MTTVIYPTLQLSNNGAVAVLDRVDAGFQVYSVPALEQRFAEDSYENIFEVLLSPSGTRIGLWTTDNSLLVIDAEGQTSYPLPHPRSNIRSLTIADSGNKLGLLRVESNGQGALEIWSLPPDDMPVAAIDLPVLDQALVTADNTFSTFMVQSRMSVGSKQFNAIYRLDSSDELSAVWQTDDPNLEPADTALYGDWVWLVQEDGLEGWRQGEGPHTLPGTLRDRVRFSPDGGHLLAYRVEQHVDVTSAKMLFRLFNLASLEEIKSVTHTVENNSTAHFVLADDLSLLELRATREAQLDIKTLSW